MNEEHFNLEIISTNPHPRVANYLHDFTIRENIPIYDSYHDQTPIPTHNHNSLFNSQVGIGNYSNSIILANPCEKKLFQNNPNCAVTLVVPVEISFYFFFHTYFVQI